MKTKILLVLAVVMSVLGLSEIKAQMDTVWSYPMPANYKPDAWAFSPNDSLITIGFSSDGDSLKECYNMILNTNTGQKVREIRGTGSSVLASTLFTPNNNYLITLAKTAKHGYANIMMWNVNTGDSVRRLSIDSLDGLDGLDYQVTDLQFTQDKRYLFGNVAKYFWSSNKAENFNQFVFWDTTNWQIAKQWKSYNQPAKMVISPIGNYYAYYSSSKNGNFMYISSLDEADTLITKFDLGNKKVFKFIFSKNGNYLAALCNKDTVLIWDMNSLNLYQSFNIPIITNISFAKDSSYLITKGQDNPTLIWDIYSKSVIYDYRDTSISLAWMTVSNSGDYIFLVDFATKRFYLYNSHFTPNPVVERGENREQSIIYPNPSDKTTKLKFNSTELSVVTIQIVDSEGNTVKDLGEKIFEEGENDINLECNGLTSGIYFCRMTGKNLNKTFKIIIKK